eukprot:4153726-Prorocentrum_lima.AAC.1
MAGGVPRRREKGYTNAQVNKVSPTSLLLKVGYDNKVKYHMYNTQLRWDGTIDTIYEMAVNNILRHNKMET